jgi:acetoacetyl-CoA synthetase
LSQPSWIPSSERIACSHLRRFAAILARDAGRPLATYADLHAMSVADVAMFWQRFVQFANLAGATWGDRVVVDRHLMPGARWFPEARLNFAEALLCRRDETPAIVSADEDGRVRRISRSGLYDDVARLAGWLRSAGIGPGDRVAGLLPNVPEAVVSMLATTAIGAVWSSCSPDFGVPGVVDRFGQIAPRLLIAAAGYRYAGRAIDLADRIVGILDALPSVETLMVVDDDTGRASLFGRPKTISFRAALEGSRGPDIDFARLPFDHPVYILFTSGTTGVPKCIVHGAGGTLLQHAKEHLLHCDIRPGDPVFYYTTCGWMMWNWLVSALASGATLVLYDGSPTHPHPARLFDLVDVAGIRLFGTSAKYLQAIDKAGVKTKETHRLTSLATITSTGSPLAAEGFDFVYERIKADVHLASISGGTDIVGCFVLGNPLSPVWRGEIQGAGLGMDVDVVDDAGRPLAAGKGELVCRQPFPSMPVGFWNDADGSRYRAAYFERFPGLWHHGDYAEKTAHGGFIIHGRSDATLNPGGVRIGTAEIYRQVETFDEILESLAIGQDWQGDVRIVLFVVMRPGCSLDDGLATAIRARIRAECSPRHVPARILEVADIPRTKSGKITEIAVRDVVHGRPVKNREVLANPDALALFANLPELQV